MPRSKVHKALTREQVAAAAGRLFRRLGYAAAGVDAVMAEAGLTRGGFYAHFESKQALFGEVMATDHGLVRKLARRNPAEPWAEQTERILADYLNPAHLSEVSAGCSFAALTGDVARADGSVREAYNNAWRRAVAELLRGPHDDWRHAWAKASDEHRQRASTLLAVAVGGLGVAQAMAGDTLRVPLLLGVQQQVLQLHRLLRL